MDYSTEYLKNVVNWNLVW